MTGGTNDDRVIAVVGETLYGMALGDIHRSLGCNYPSERITEDSELADGQCLVGSVMLACALIEAIGHHCLGHRNHSSEEAFSEFVNSYLRQIENRYVAVDLWQVLRNGLLHNYATRHNRGVNPVRFVLIKNARDSHLEAVPNRPNHVYLNVQSFIDHVDRAAHRFLDELEVAGTNERTRTLAWVGTNEVMTVFPVMLPDVAPGSGVLLLDSASSVMPPADAAAQVAATLTATGHISPRNLMFSQGPSWQQRDRNRSRAGRTIR